MCHNDIYQPEDNSEQTKLTNSPYVPRTNSHPVTLVGGNVFQCKTHETSNSKNSPSTLYQPTFTCSVSGEKSEVTWLAYLSWRKQSTLIFWCSMSTLYNLVTVEEISFTQIQNRWKTLHGCHIMSKNHSRQPTIRLRWHAPGWFWWKSIF